MKKKNLIWSLLAIVMAATMSVGLSSCDTTDHHDEVTVYPPSVSFPSNGGQQAITVKSNTKWTVTGMMTGVTVMPTKGEGDGTIMLIATENTEKSPRTGYFTVNAGDASAMIMVTQSQQDIPSGVTIVNNSTKTFKRFTVIFRNSKEEMLSQQEFGDLLPNNSINVSIPTGASTYYVAIYDGGWYFSADYDVSVTTLSLTNTMVWYTN